MNKVCLKCGNCLYYCPVYRELREEGYSPRGRISLIEEKKNSGFDFSLFEKDFLHKCLLCGACEKNCKEGLKLTSIFIEERAKNYKNYAPILKKSMLFFAKEFLYIEEKLSKKEKDNLSSGSEKRVVFFKGCAIEKFFKKTVNISKKILEGNGYSVIEDDFTCCGFPFLSSGNEEEFLKLKEKNMKIFSRYKGVPIITFCPTGKHTLKEYYKLDNVFDIIEFLEKNKIKVNVRLKNKERYSLHIPCHVINYEKPDYLINFSKKYIPDIFIPEEQMCCGFGGLFSVTYPRLSSKILKKSSKNLKMDMDHTVLTNCPGCILQLRREGKAIHIIELITNK